MAHRGRENADDALLLQLAAGRTAVEAARAAGVSARTAQRRLAAADFRQRLRHLQTELVERALARLVEASCAAVDTLRQLLEAEGENIRLAAAKAILDLAGKMRAAAESERRSALWEQSQD